MTYIILTVMVRNESKALPRLLRSVARVVDAVALSDTGSTDRTIEVATQLCGDLGLPLVVTRDVWSDFGTNRTKNLEHGRAVAAISGRPPSECFMLLMDADMEIPKGTPRPAALPVIGLLPQRGGTTVWSNVRTLRVDLEARYVGRTHEYIAHAPAEISKLNWFEIMDHGDGGCKADKFERDERLLRLDLAEKGDPRSMFYLAQTLQNLGRLKEAAELYDRRAAFPDSPEESWLARLEASRCCQGPQADQRAWEAFFSRPKRAEPLADIAVRAADQGRHHTAMAAAAMGKLIEIPSDEALFLRRDLYKFPFAYAEMISGFYTGARELGAQACDFLRLCHGSPWAWVALSNQQYYADVVPGKRAPIAFQAPAGFVPMNPVLRKTEDGWLGLIRTVNYRIAPSGGYVTPEGVPFTPTTPIVTRNFVVLFDDAMVPRGEPRELLAPKSPHAKAVVQGFEDLRIVALDEAQAVMLTSGPRLDANAAGVPEFWESTWDLRTGACIADRRIGAAGRCEKNWLPLEDGYLYGHTPEGVVFTDRSGAPRAVVTQAINAAGFRGSAAPIPYADGFLYVIHEVWQPEGGRRIYTHRFVYATRTPEQPWRIAAVSRAVLLHGQPCIECCFSINTVPGGVLLSCSREDQEIFTIAVSTADVDLLLSKGTAIPAPKVAGQ